MLYWKEDMHRLHFEGMTVFNTRTTDVFITELRKHLQLDPEVEIINARVRGYKLILLIG